MADAMEMLRDAATNFSQLDEQDHLVVEVMKLKITELVIANQPIVQRLLDRIQKMAAEEGTASGMLLLFAMYCAIESMKLSAAGMPGFRHINQACIEVCADYAGFTHQQDQTLKP